MSKNQFLLIITLGLFSCSSNSNEELVIKEFLETRKGVRTDLKIDFKSIETSNILVSDSIAILNKEFEDYKAKKIENCEQSIKRKKASIEEQRQSKSKDKIVAKVLISKWSDELVKLEKDLKETKSIKQVNSQNYPEREPTEVLAKKAKTNFTFFNPQLQTKQELNADFILSADGKSCLKMIKQ